MHFLLWVQMRRRQDEDVRVLRIESFSSRMHSFDVQAQDPQTQSKEMNEDEFCWTHTQEHFVSCLWKEVYVSRTWSMFIVMKIRRKFMVPTARHGIHSRLYCHRVGNKRIHVYFISVHHQQMLDVGQHPCVQSQDTVST